MDIINPGKEDFHMHSINFSDGMNTIDEITNFAGKIGLKKIAITDHSQNYLDKKNLAKKTFAILSKKRWQNVFNKTKVILGIEGDLLNSNGDISIDIQNQTCDFNILSTHPGVYDDKNENITMAYLNAIEKHHKKIKFLGHPCLNFYEDYIDINAVIEQANKFDVAMEFNCANFYYKKTNLKNLNTLLTKCHKVYINSDSHTLYELKTFRSLGFKYLKEQGFIKRKFFHFSSF